MKNSLPDALAAAYGLPEGKALDLLETQPIARIRATLRDCGWLYDQHARRWQSVDLPNL